MGKPIKIASACMCFIPLQGKAQQVQHTKEHPNILFICIDDLRRELGAYGSEVLTPNIDRLASQGSLFFEHYVQIPTSGASRASMLTGYRPQNWDDLSNEAYRLQRSPKPEEEHPETMFHQLRRNGYYTVGIGKISHYVDGLLYDYREPMGDKYELPYSWDEMLFDHGKWGTGWNAFFGYSDGSNRQVLNNQCKPYECVDGDDTSLPDGLTANLAVKKIQELSQKEQPFCLAVGFFKPHLPFTSPKKYWDLYDESKISLAPEQDIPENCHAELALHNSSEFNQYKLGDEVVMLDYRVDDSYARKLRHAYFACISYTDAQVGKVLDALEKTGQADNTIIILWGDHGWHLGDQRIWGKHTVMESSLASALIVKAPGGLKGVKNHRIVSSIDLYPTLMELSGVDTPDDLHGKSFARLLTDPESKKWKDCAYSYYRAMMSMRVPGYRLSQYRNGDEIFTELYKYTDDFTEHKNIADENPKLVKKFLKLLEKGKTPAFYANKK